MRIRLAVLALSLTLAPSAARAADGALTPLDAGLGAAKFVAAQPRADRSYDLYSGTPGRLFVLLEAWKATGDERFLADARVVADDVLAGVDLAAGGREFGLYTGLAGMGAALLEAHRLTGDSKYADGVRKIVGVLEQRAVKHNGDGARWSFTTDVISGTAGVGLFLVETAKALDDSKALALAARAGKSLLGAAAEAPGGLDWKMQPMMPVVMPNFSHGTAGVAYFLATLFEATKKKEYLDAAIAGANHLLAVADQSGDGCIVFHYEASGKRGEPLLGWCHGPPGTSRLFERLARATGDAKWRDWTLRGARSLVERGEKAKALWDNSSLCCGTAGVGDFFLDLYRSTGDERWLVHARTLATDIVGRAHRGPEGAVSWGAPSRTANPDLRTDESSLMQGAAGIGLFLLRFDAAEKKRESAARLVDTPFR